MIGARSVVRERVGEGGDARRFALGEDQEAELVADEARERVLRLAEERPRRRASVSRIESPTAMPTESLTCLKRSRSITITVGRMVESALRERKRRIEPVEEQLAVRQAGEVVVHGVVQQALLGGLELGDVGERCRRGA